MTSRNGRSTTADTVGDFLVERLREWGVRRVFGYPGDGINGVVLAFGREAAEGIEWVQARHEEMLAFMACGQAKFTGEVGVCVATSGPGAIHLLNGLYDAKLDHQPVVAIVGQQARSALGGSYQQEVNLEVLFSDVAAYVEEVVDPAQARHVVDRAFRTALGERAVACVIVPTDVQEADAVAKPPHEHGTVHSSVGYSPPRVVPIDDELARAADVLNAGERVAMLVGQGALHASDEVVGVADMLGAGVAKALLGKAAVSDDLPFVTGAIGLLGTKPSWDLMQQCDTLLLVGTGFPYSEFLPQEGQARAVQIDIDPRMIGLRYPTEVNLVGDSRETLRALLPLLEEKRDRSWREQIEQEVADWWATLQARAMQEANPLNPQRLFWELSARLPADSIICGDSGSSTNWLARDLKVRPGMQVSVSSTLASMGSALPYAIAAKFAHPTRVVFALAGDGAMQMNGLAELITIAKYRERWADARLVVLVLNNRDLNQVTWEHRAMESSPKFPTSQNLPDVGYADFARSLGLAGRRIESPEEVGAAWDEALRADRPFVIDAVVDPDVPPLPPHITLDQAVSMTRALLKGDPDWRGIIRQTLRDKLSEVLPRH
ncbi:MAG: thiamine pyrophosphate-requiring protein [Actinomycetota bacterium]|nr:thiamine pyrophosphate-requiring protein [Actinomycetota bacterium]